MLSPISLAADDAERAKLIGTWETRQPQTLRATWILAAKGSALQVTHIESDRKSEVKCNTVGRECAVQDSGKPVKVSMWFNGPKLVVMETRGSEILKRRFQTVGDGNELDLEVVPIVPQRKRERFRLLRVASSR
jgi:hypothetical protein